MKKITLALAGLALAASASMVPASANGVYVNTPGSSTTFTFFPTTNYSLFTTPAKFIDFSTGTTTVGNLTLSGIGLEPGTSFVFDNTTLLFSAPGVSTIETGKSTLTFSGGKISVTSFGPSFSGSGSTGDYVAVSTAAVPEASTVVSFAGLLALGGLAVLRRKSVKNAA